jgi:hydrogenase maturation protease
VRIVVVGIGHSLRGDDAAGLEAVRAWQRDHADTARSPTLHVRLVESPGMELAEVFDGADAALLVDAVQSGAEAGTLHRVSEADISPLIGCFGSMHGWGLPEALRLARSLGFRPGNQHVRLLGIEASEMALGAPPSLAVRNAIPAASDAIEAEVRAFLEK